jgi:hypothetical protein
VQAVAGGGLRHLDQQRLGIAEQQLVQGSPPFRFGPQGVGPHPQGFAGDLGKGLARLPAAAQEGGEARHALVAHHAHLGRRAVVHEGDQRDDATAGEIDVGGRLVGVAEDLLELQLDGFQLGEEALVLLPGQGRQQAVLARDTAGFGSGHRHLGRCGRGGEIPSPKYTRSVRRLPAQTVDTVFGA